MSGLKYTSQEPNKEEREESFPYSTKKQRTSMKATERAIAAMVNTRDAFMSTLSAS